MAARSDCPACEHPLVAQINLDRSPLSGKRAVPLRQMEKTYGIDKSALHIHFNEAHPGTPLAVASEADAPEDLTDWTDLAPVDRLKRIRDHLQRRVDTGKARTDEVRELRITVGEIAKMEGDDRPKEATVADVMGLQELLHAMAEALEPFPEARAAMAAAVTEWERRSGQQVPA